MSHSSSPEHAEHQVGHHVAPDFPAPVRALAGLSRALAAVEGVGIALSLAMLIALATWQFVARNVRMKMMPALLPDHVTLVALLDKLPHAPEWSDNVLRHAVFLTGFLGAMFASYSARHLRVDALTRLAAPRPRLVLRVLSTFGAIVISAIVIWAALRFRDSVADETPTEGEIFTAARSAMIIVIGLAGMIFHFAVQIAIDLSYLASRREIPGWWIAEASHGGEGGEGELQEHDADLAPAAPTVDGSHGAAR